MQSRILIPTYSVWSYLDNDFTASNSWVETMDVDKTSFEGSAWYVDSYITVTTTSSTTKLLIWVIIVCSVVALFALTAVGGLAYKFSKVETDDKKASLILYEGGPIDEDYTPLTEN